MLFDTPDSPNAVKWIDNMKDFNPICDPNKILVVMCVWKRFQNIEETLTTLDANNIPINLCIFNNNYSKKNDFITNINKVNVKNIDVNVYHSPDNIRGIGRFVMTHYICKYIHNYDRVFFVDDDQSFDKEFLKSFLNMFDKYENSAIFWFGKIFCDKTIKEDKNPYWSPQSWSTLSVDVPEHIKLIKNSLLIENTINTYHIHYGGTGGCIYPTNVFQSLDIFNYNEKYRHIEDLTLSYLFKYEYNGQLIANLNNNNLIDNIRDIENVTQYKGLIHVKNELLKELHNYYEK